MQQFIVGILEENNDGATYEDRIYDRFLKLRSSLGQVLQIFDFIEPISTGLQTGQIYEVILVPTIFASLSYSRKRLTDLEVNTWEGKILSRTFLVSKNNYQRNRPRLYDQEWILLSTIIGHLLISPAEIDVPIDEGGFIYWQNPRWDLYAVI